MGLHVESSGPNRLLEGRRRCTCLTTLHMHKLLTNHGREVLHMSMEKGKVGLAFPKTQNLGLRLSGQGLRISERLAESEVGTSV